MRKFRSIIIALLCAAGAAACDDRPDDVRTLEAVLTGYDDFNNAELDLTRADMEAAGFVPGDVLSVSILDEVLELPYHTGYFTRIGEMVVVDYPTYTHTIITASSTGLSEKYLGLEGTKLTFSLKLKGGALEAERILGMQYSNDRDDYSDDAEFANARVVATSGMAGNRIYRSASPFDNKFGRAPYVSAYLEEQGVRTALNLTDNEETARSYQDVPSYSRKLMDGGDVIFCKINTNYRSGDFNARMIDGLKEMSARPAPYVIHCTEGKDRTGYVCAVLEALAGASYDEIVEDYLLTYRNYFHITPKTNPEACEALLSLRLNDALMYYCGVDDESLLPSVDLGEAVARYLLAHGMTQPQLDALKAAICE